MSRQNGNKLYAAQKLTLVDSAHLQYCLIQDPVKMGKTFWEVYINPFNATVASYCLSTEIDPSPRLGESFCFIYFIRK